MRPARKRRGPQAVDSGPSLLLVLFAAALAMVLGVFLGIAFGRFTSDKDPQLSHLSTQERNRPVASGPKSPPANEEARRSKPRRNPPIYEEPLPPDIPEVLGEDTRNVSLSPPSAVEGRLAEPPAKAETPAWQRYASLSPDVPGAPMIAIIIDDVGHDPGRQAERLRRLPGPITLSMLPYGYELPRLAAAFRGAGHEVMVHMPMEPSNESLDPGPNALLVGLDRGELLRRLKWNLEQFEGYVGVNNHMGSRFTQKREAMAMVMREIGTRGLLFVDSWTSGASLGDSLARGEGIPQARRDVFLDNDVSLNSILKQLALTEKIARKRGYAVAIGHPHKATLEALERWLPEVRQRGYVLVPITAIVKATLAG